MVSTYRIATGACCRSLGEAMERRAWDTLVDTAWNPNVPTLREAMEQVLSPDERERLVTRLRPVVERGEGEWRIALAHLSGVRV